MYSWVSLTVGKVGSSSPMIALCQSDSCTDCWTWKNTATRCMQKKWGKYGDMNKVSATVCLRYPTGQQQRWAEMLGEGVGQSRMGGRKERWQIKGKKKRNDKLDLGPMAVAETKLVAGPFNLCIVKIFLFLRSCDQPPPWHKWNLRVQGRDAKDRAMVPPTSLEPFISMPSGKLPAAGTHIYECEVLFSISTESFCSQVWQAGNARKVTLFSFSFLLERNILQPTLVHKDHSLLPLWLGLFWDMHFI